MSARFSARTGFTLIELLVVVAIIAILISVLLLSLSKARAQARTSVCASRIGQLCKAMLLYADAYDEAPPFMGRGWENANELSTGEWPAGSGITVEQWAHFEDWLMPDMPDYWMTSQVDGDWPDHALVRHGSLFSYTRFENLYRCPEFERVGPGIKTQNAFNYTRSLLGRKWFDRSDPEGQDGSPWRAEYDGPFGAPGPIIRISQGHVPARMFMLVDEHWRRHCAAPIDEFQEVAPEGLLVDQDWNGWMAADCMFYMLADEGGRYHDPPSRSSLMPSQVAHFLEPVKSASRAFYDGHVALEVEPLPNRLIDLGWGLEALLLGVGFWNWTEAMFFTQRGKAHVDLGGYTPF